MRKDNSYSADIRWLNDIICCPQHIQSASQHHHPHPEVYLGALSTYATTGMFFGPVTVPESLLSGAIPGNRDMSYVNFCKLNISIGGFTKVKCIFQCSISSHVHFNCFEICSSFFFLQRQWTGIIHYSQLDGKSITDWAICWLLYNWHTVSKAILQLYGPEHVLG